VKKTPENGKTSQVHRLAELILWRWLHYHKQPTDSMQFPMSFFIDIGKKSVPKFIWKHPRSQIANTILSKRSNAESISKLVFKL
jgi:hypothetical protein